MVKETNVQTLVINKLSKEKYNQLSEAGQISPYELYITPDEPDITKLSDLENDVGYITESDIDLTEYASKTYVSSVVSPKADTTYVDRQLDLKADKTEIPTKVSELENDSEYLTEHQDISGKADKATTLEGYGIADAYTKEEVNELLETLEDYATIEYVDGALNQKVDSTTYASDLEQLALDHTTINNSILAVTENVNLLRTDLNSGLGNLDTNKANKSEVYTKDEIDAKGYLTEHQDISGKADTTYVNEELSKKADKTELPTKLSELENDANYLQNSASDEYSLSILGVEANTTRSTMVGIGSNAGNYSTAIGAYAVASADGSVAVGRAARTSQPSTIAIGVSSQATAPGAIALGAQAVNNEEKTFKVALSTNKDSVPAVDESTGLYTLLKADGKIPNERLDLEAYALKEEIPTKVSELENDSGYLTEHQDISGKADKSTTLAGYGITDAYTKEEVDAKISSVYKYKGSVANYNSLPTTDLVVGDVYNVEDTGDNYVWNGTIWDKLAGDIDLTPYLTKEEASTTYETIANVQSHTSNVSNPHKVTKEQVGLGNVDNTSDANKPISTATQNALSLKADDSAVVHLTGDETISGAKTFTTSPLVPSIADTTDSTQSVASTKFVQDVVNANKPTITYWD